MAALAVRAVVLAGAFAGAMKLLDDRDGGETSNRKRLDDIKRQIRNFEDKQLPGLQAYLNDEHRFLFDYESMFSEKTHGYLKVLIKDCDALREAWLRVDEEVYHHPPKNKGSSVWRRIRRLEVNISDLNDTLNGHLRLYRNSKHNDTMLAMMRNGSVSSQEDQALLGYRDPRQLALPAP